MHLAEARIRNIAIEADTGCRQDQGSTLPRFPKAITGLRGRWGGVEELEAGFGRCHAETSRSGAEANGVSCWTDENHQPRPVAISSPIAPFPDSLIGSLARQNDAHSPRLGRDYRCDAALDNNQFASCQSGPELWRGLAVRSSGQGFRASRGISHLLLWRRKSLKVFGLGRGAMRGSSHRIPPFASSLLLLELGVA